MQKALSNGTENVVVVYLCKELDTSPNRYSLPFSLSIKLLVYLRKGQTKKTLPLILRYNVPIYTNVSHKPPPLKNPEILNHITGLCTLRDIFCTFENCREHCTEISAPPFSQVHNGLK